MPRSRTIKKEPETHLGEESFPSSAGYYWGPYIKCRRRLSLSRVIRERAACRKDIFRTMRLGQMKLGKMSFSSIFSRCKKNLYPFFSQVPQITACKRALLVSPVSRHISWQCRPALTFHARERDPTMHASLWVERKEGRMRTREKSRGDISSVIPQGRKARCGVVIFALVRLSSSFSPHYALCINIHS